MRGRPTRWLVVSVVLVLGCGGTAPDPRAFNSLAGASLAKARAQHRTKLLVEKPAPGVFEPDVPVGATVIRYPAAGGANLAWLLRPTGPGPFPAVLYAHAGNHLSTGDYPAAKPFVEAGYVVLMPAWRGENGNPGRFEMCYGEVADAAAALDYLAALPEVDPQRLFAAGHDTGGTIVMLLAESTPRLRAAAACGGIPDLRTLTEEKKQPVLKDTPFDWRDPIETDLRSPARHPRDLACPLLLFYAEKNHDAYLLQAGKMQQDALALEREMLVNRLTGTDQNTAIDRAVPAMIAFFKLHMEGKRP